VRGVTAGGRVASIKGSRVGGHRRRQEPITRTHRFVFLGLGYALSLSPPLSAAAETSHPAQPASVVTAKRIVCQAVRVRVCRQDGTCKPDSAPSGLLTVDFARRTYVEGRQSSPRGAIKRDRIENGVRKFTAAASERGAPDIEFELDAAGAMKIVWLERAGTMELDARCTAA